jgi:hypothetical protein
MVLACLALKLTAIDQADFAPVEPANLSRSMSMSNRISPSIKTRPLITVKRTAKLAIALAALAALVATAARADTVGTTEAPRNPCTTQGWHETRALLDDRGVPQSADLLEAYTTLFCKAAPMSRASQRVGFPFSQTSEGEVSNAPAGSHLFTTLMERREFLEHYHFLSVNSDEGVDNYKPIAAVEAVRYSAKHDIATLKQTANECGSATLQFRRYQGKWIWFGERIAGCGV